MAKKFKLQAVLKYRKTLEEQAQQKLAELLSVESGLKVKQAESSVYLETLSEQLLQKQQLGLSILELRLYEDQIDFHRQQSEQIQHQLDEISRLLNESRQELLVAAREYKIIAKLKEKKLAEVLREFERKERIMLDEISLRQKEDTE